MKPEREEIAPKLSMKVPKSRVKVFEPNFNSNSLARKDELARESFGTSVRVLCALWHPCALGDALIRLNEQIGESERKDESLEVCPCRRKIERGSEHGEASRFKNIGLQDRAGVAAVRSSPDPGRPSPADTTAAARTTIILALPLRVTIFLLSRRETTRIDYMVCSLG